MADGSIRIGIKFDNSQAKKGSDDLVKQTENAIKKLEKITKNMTVNYDVEGAKKSLKSLDKVITDSQKNIEKAKSSFEKNVETEIKALEKEAESYVKPLAEADDELEKQQQTVAKLEARLKSVSQLASYGDNPTATAKVKQISAELENAKQKERELIEISAQLGEKYEYAKNMAAEIKANPEASQSFKSMTADVEKYEAEIKDAENEEKEIGNGLKKAKNKATALTTAATASKKAFAGMKTAVATVAKGTGKLVKSVGKSLVNGIKNGVSKFKDMGDSVESVRKKALKIGLALIGMRGAMGVLKKAVSSALSDNEELQNQLTAIKGMMGQALAPVIQVLLNGLQQVITFADKLYQIFFKTSLIAKYNAKQTANTAKSTKNATKNAKDYNKQMASFDVANTLSDSSSSDTASDEAEEVANLFKPAKIKAWMKDIISAFKKGNWKSAGTTVAKAINDALAKISWKKVQNKVKEFTAALSEAINGFVEFLDWDLLGSTAAEAINTITTAITNFVDTIDWNMLGGKISDALNSLVNTVNAKDLGKTLTSGLKVLTDTLYGFFNGEDGKGGFDFSNLGDKFGEMVISGIKNVNWEKFAKNAASIVNGLFKFLNSTIEKLKDSDLHIGTKIAEKLLTFLSNVEWGEVGKFIKNAITGMCDAIGDFFKRLNKNDDAYNTVVDGLKDFFNGLDIDEIAAAFGEMVLNITKFTLKFTGNASKAAWESLSKWISEISENFNFEFWDKPKLAKGGIVNNPGRGVTATVGEAGAEAVLPLENNTDWMDSLAEKLASKIGAGDTVVTLKLDSKTLSKEVIKATNRRRYLTGGRA